MYSIYSKKLKEDPWVRKYDIKEVSKHRKGFTVYKVTSKIFPRNSIEAVTEVVVWKRFSDFKKLHKSLSMIHQGLHLKGNFPTFVKTQIFGRFEEKVIEERRQCALRLLEFASELPALYNSQPFIKFFEDVQVVQPSSEVPELEEPLRPIREEHILCKIESGEALGGTWSHRREAEDISLSSSSCSSSSGGSTSPLTPSDFLLFDPLAGNARARSDSQSDRSWLLSAIQSCSKPESIGSEGGSFPSFDFPPPFAEDEDPAKISLSPPDHKEEEDPNRDFLSVAGRIVSEADRLELLGNNQGAFSCYKEAVGILLGAVREERDPLRKDILTRKTAQYLSRAEDLYERFISCASPWGASRPVSVISPRGDVEELARFKVVGIVGKVVLVRDTADDRIKVIKSLWKSGSSHISGVPNIVPQTIPFMVALEKTYHTDYAVYLVLEYAPNGRLWESISSYLQLSPATPGAVDCPTPSCNVYSGKKVCRKSNDERREEGAPSYVSLCASYARFVKSCDRPSDSGSDSGKDIATATNCQEVGGCNEIDSLISSSKALLETVNQTLKSTLSEQGRSLKGDESMSDGNGDGSGNALTHRSRHLSSSTGKLDVPQRRLQMVMTHLELSACNSPTRLPESSVRAWGSQMVVALSGLHLLGIIWQDLKPDNVLVGDGGQVLLTYQSRWNGVDSTLSSEAKHCLYSAPEVGQICPVTPACDWWSLGALLFELLTGRTLLSCHPSGITSHTILCVPDGISPEAGDLLLKLLQFYPSARLGAGSHGLESIKAHPFFAGVEWSALSCV